MAGPRDDGSGRAEQDGGTEPTDGRTARRDRNRERVLDAVIELFSEGNVATPAVVAERSGVSLRSVYRYVEDTDALVRAAIARHLERAASLLEVPDLDVGDLDERVARLVGARLRVYDEVGATIRIAQARVLLAGTGDPAARPLSERLRASRREILDQIRAALGPELDRLPPERAEAATATIDALLQIEGLDHLRSTRRLSPRRATAVLAAAIASLLET